MNFDRLSLKILQIIFREILEDFLKLETILKYKRLTNNFCYFMILKLENDIKNCDFFGIVSIIS